MMSSGERFSFCTIFLGRVILNDDPFEEMWDTSMSCLRSIDANMSRVVYLLLRIFGNYVYGSDVLHIEPRDSFFIHAAI